MSDRIYRVEGRECSCYSRSDCPVCCGTDWVYETSTPCDGCGDAVVVAQSMRPVWNPEITGGVWCEDCERGTK